MTIPDQAIEAAAKDRFESKIVFGMWVDASEQDREDHRELVRPIVEAAAPHIEKAAFRGAGASYPAQADV